MPANLFDLLTKSLTGAIAASALAVSFLGTDAIADSHSAGNAALFNSLDANADGVLTRREVPQVHARLYTRLVRRAGAENAKLTRDEFIEALIPSRPEKPIEAKQPALLPHANAVRYLLLSIDTNLDSVIEPDEVPREFQDVFDTLVDRLDRNDNNSLEPIELSRGGIGLAQIAGTYISNQEIKLRAELKKLEKTQGAAARRFDENRRPGEMLRDPVQTKALFVRLDSDGDKKLDPDEVPEPFKPQIERFMRLADLDRDGRLSEREFLEGAKRIAPLLP
jgi:hypothetical protein